MTGAPDEAYSVALQRDGKIVVGGITHGGHVEIAVVRYNPDGTLDSSFGRSGKVTAGFRTYEGFKSVALQEDGKIVVAGDVRNSDGVDFAVVRYEGGPICGGGTPEVGEDCDDGDACTQDSCDPIDGCQNLAEPATSCVDGWEKGSLLVKEDVAGKERFLATLRDGPRLSLSDFGDPLLPTTGYTVCVYDDAKSLAGRLSVPPAVEKWKRVRNWRYVYRDQEAEADGIRALWFRRGCGGGKSRIMLSAANDASKDQTSLPTGIAAALAGSTSATVQIHGSDAPECFSTTLSTVVRDTGNFFKAK